MERIPDQRYAELIGEAYSCIPPNIVKLIDHVHFFCGTDPVYAGLVKDVPIFDGKYSSRNWMYALNVTCLDWAVPMYLRHPTIVIPYFNFDVFDTGDIVHELGHILDDCFAHEIPDIDIVSEYAKTNYTEAFAEAFESWLFWNYAKQPEGVILEFFERLKAGEPVE